MRQTLDAQFGASVRSIFIFGTPRATHYGKNFHGEGPLGCQKLRQSVFGRCLEKKL